MSKILKLKEWLTIEEAATRLSASAGEEVSGADVLRFALDGHLTLSVYFVNHARGTRGRVVPYTETQWALVPPSMLPDKTLKPATASPEATVTIEPPENLKKLLIDSPTALLQGYVPYMDSLKIDENRYLNLEREVVTLRGVWDLPMWGAEALDVENLYQNMVGGPTVTLMNLEGAFVLGSDGYAYQLKESWEHNEYQAGSKAQHDEIKRMAEEEGLAPEAVEKLMTQHAANRKKFLEIVRSRDNTGNSHENYYPAGGLPPDSTFVVRTTALRAFEEKLLSEDAQPEKPLHPRERQSVSQIIAALAAMAQLDLSTPYKADEPLRAAAARHGITLPSSPETVVKFLSAAAEYSGKS